MSMGPMGMIGSIAGTPLAQTKVSQHEGEVPHAPPPTRPGSSSTADVHAAGIGQIEEELIVNLSGVCLVMGVSLPAYFNCHFHRTLIMILILENSVLL